jgi:hypothetical protein
MLRTMPQFTPTATPRIANARPAYSTQPQRQGATFWDIHDSHYLGTVLKIAQRQVVGENQDAFLSECVNLIHQILNLPNTRHLRLRVDPSTIPGQSCIRLLDPQSNRTIIDHELTWTIDPQNPWRITQKILTDLRERLPSIANDSRFTSGRQLPANPWSLDDVHKALFNPPTIDEPSSCLFQDFSG